MGGKLSSTKIHQKKLWKNYKNGIHPPSPPMVITVLLIDERLYPEEFCNQITIKVGVLSITQCTSVVIIRTVTCICGKQLHTFP